MTPSRAALFLVSAIAPGCGAVRSPVTSPSAAVASDDVVAFGPGITAQSVIARGFAVGSAALVADARVPATQCVRFDVGLAPGVEDADLFVYEDSGSLVAADDGAARFATAIVCAAAERRVHLRAVAARGAGELAFAASPIAHDAIRHLAIDDRAIAIPVATAADALRRRVVGELGTRGFRLEAGPLAVTLEAEVPLHLGVSARAGDCVVVVARPDEGGATLQLVGDDGTVVSDDAGRERDLGVSFCSVAGQPLSAVVTSPTSGQAHVIVLRGLAREVGGTSSVAIGRPRVRP